jgi:hypothetical protein
VCPALDFMPRNYGTPPAGLIDQADAKETAGLK